VCGHGTPDGQLLKDEKGRYSPANPTASGNPGATGNPTGNPDNSRNQHTYEEKEKWVTGVTGVCGHGTPDGHPCDDCEIDELFGGGE
jgi:hypothetical protein